MRVVPVFGLLAMIFATMANATVVTWPQPDGMTLTNGEYRVCVNGELIQLY